jgi:hypothetical protein
MMHLSMPVLNAGEACGEFIREEAVFLSRTLVLKRRSGLTAGGPRHAAEAALPVRPRLADRNDGRCIDIFKDSHLLSSGWDCPDRFTSLFDFL